MFSEAAFEISRFRNVYDNRPWSLEVSFSELRRLLTEWQAPRRIKTHTPCWSPASYPEGATRGKRTVRAVSAVVFDCDDGTPAHAARTAFAGWCQIGHTSWSHSHQTPKWRLVLPLAEPVPGQDWPAAFAAALQMWAMFMPAGSQPDRRCRDASRLFFLPVYRAGQDDRAAWADEGELMRLEYTPGQVAPKADAAPKKTWQVLPVIRHRLRHEAAARAALGALVGGVARGGLIVGVPCPACQEPSARWPIDPDRSRGGYCGNEECDWAGPLDIIASQLGEMV